MRAFLFLQPSFPLLLLAALVFVAPWPSLAAELAPIKTTGNVKNISAILRYSKDHCEEILRPLADPATIIKAGLQALGDAANADRVQTCLDDVVTRWERFDSSLALFGKARPGDLLDQAEAAVAAARRNVVCVLPGKGPMKAAEAKYKELNFEYCNGVFFPSSQAAAKKAELDAANYAVTELLEARKVRLDLLPNLVKLADLISNSNIEPERNLVTARLGCVEGANPLPTVCGGKTLAAEEIIGLKQRSEELNAQAYQESEKNVLRREAFKEAVAASEYGDGPLDYNKALEFTYRLHCAGVGYEEALAVCGKKGYPTNGSAEVIRSAQSHFKDAKAIADAWIEGREARAKLVPKVNQEANAKYALRRLLARYQAFSRRFGNDENSLQKFCAANEEMQKVDAEYAAEVGGIPSFQYDLEWKYVQEQGLSEAGVSVLRDYTMGEYARLNSAIWASKSQLKPAPLGSRESKEMAILNSALAEAKPYRAGPVRRRSILPEEVLAQHQIGAVVTYDAFTSTSKTPNWIDGKKGQNTFLIYPGIKGVDIQTISRFPAEEEVLFQAGTRFKVLSRKPMEGSPGNYTFVMAEVDEVGAVINPPPASNK